jgi:tetratricopeptide (TPR) repeat protein
MRSNAQRVLLFAALLAGQQVFAGPSSEPLVGPRVGSADLFMSEGTKLYNRKQYKAAAESFAKATRANPQALSQYLQLSRALLANKEIMRACYVYRVYLKAAPDTPERKKAQAESDQCERQLKSAKNQPPDMGQKYVDTRASFFGALEKRDLLGPSGAADYLRTLVGDGFLGPELGEMASKLGQAAVAMADEIHNRALKGERTTVDQLRMARPLYGVASEVGASPADASARMAFLDGLAFLSEKEFGKAETLFTEASKLDTANKEYVFYRGLALFQGGKRADALLVMESELKDDPRTQVLRVAMAVQSSPENGAAELEKLLFSARWKADQK